MIIAILDSGISNDIVGYRKCINYVDEKKEDKWDNFGHGTMCFNVIKSIDAAAPIDVIKVLDKYGHCDVEILCKALSDLIDSDVDIINLSLSVSGYLDRYHYDQLNDICKQLCKKRKMIICAAKNYSDKKTFPAAFENVLGVLGMCTKWEDAYYYNPLFDYQIRASDIPILTRVDKKGMAVFFKGNSKATALVTGLISKNGINDLFMEEKEICVASTAKFVFNYMLYVGEKELFVEYQQEFFELRQMVRSLSILDKLGSSDFFSKTKCCFNINNSNLYFNLVKEIEKTYHCEYFYESIRLLDFSNIYTLFWGIKQLWKRKCLEIKKRDGCYEE